MPSSVQFNPVRSLVPVKENKNQTSEKLNYHRLSKARRNLAVRAIQAVVSEASESLSAENVFSIQGTARSPVALQEAAALALRTSLTTFRQSGQSSPFFVCGVKHCETDMKQSHVLSWSTSTPLDKTHGEQQKMIAKKEVIVFKVINVTHR